MSRRDVYWKASESNRPWLGGQSFIDNGKETIIPPIPVAPGKAVIRSSYSSLEGLRDVIFVTKAKSS
jgi:hypothetical protein